MSLINKQYIDEETVRNISIASDEEIVENLDHFFEYLEDANRLYSIPLARQLAKRFDLIKNKLYEVFSKENSDDAAKRHIMEALFGYALEEEQIKEVEDILLRIINDPSPSELNEELNETAQMFYDFLYASDAEYLELYEEIIQDIREAVREGSSFGGAEFPIVAKRFHLIKDPLSQLLSENEKDIKFKKRLIEKILDGFFFKKEHILEFTDDLTRIIERPLPEEQELALLLKSELNKALSQLFSKLP